MKIDRELKKTLRIVVSRTVCGEWSHDSAATPLSHLHKLRQLGLVELHPREQHGLVFYATPLAYKQEALLVDQMLANERARINNNVRPGPSRTAQLLRLDEIEESAR